MSVKIGDVRELAFTINGKEMNQTRTIHSIDYYKQNQLYKSENETRIILFEYHQNKKLKKSTFKDLKGTITRENFFDEHSRLIYRKDENSVNTYENTYDSENRIVKSIKKAEDGTTETETFYEYGSNGKDYVQKELKDGELVVISEHIFNENGKRNYIKRDNKETFYEYGPKGRYKSLTEKTNGKETLVQNFSYSDDGHFFINDVLDNEKTSQIIVEDIFDENDQKIMSLTYWTA